MRNAGSVRARIHPLRQIGPTMSAASNGRVGLRTVFARPGYRRLWRARTASQAGDVFHTVALSLLVLLVLRLTGSGLGISAVVVAEIVPVLVLVLAGTLVDRFPRVRLMIGADLLRAGLAGVLPYVAGHVGAVFVVAFGMSVGAVMFNPAANSTLPALVDDRELAAGKQRDLDRRGDLADRAGPARGCSCSPPPLDRRPASTPPPSLLTAAILTRLRVPPPDTSPTTATAIATAEAGRHGWFADAAAGVRIISDDRALRALAAGQLLAALSAGATSALLVLLAARHLHTGPAGYGLLLGAIGVGAAAGPLLLTRLVANPRRPTFVFGPYLLRGLIDLVLATVTALPVALVAVAGYGLGTSTGAVTFNSLLQARTPAAARGRVFATFDLLWQLGRLGSLVLGGLAADALGIQAVYYLGGALLLLAAVIGWHGLLTRPSGAHARPTNTVPGTGDGDPA